MSQVSPGHLAIEPALDPRTQVSRMGHVAMACTIELIVVGGDEPYVQEAARELFEEVDRLEAQLSRFVEDSDVSQMNHSAAGQWVRVGPATLECMKLAKQLHTDTCGAFDVTVRSPRPPNEQQAPMGDTRVDMSFVEVSEDYRAIGFRGDDIRIDLGGLGKGYALDQMAVLLGEWEIDAALVHTGQSTVLAIGTPPGADAWHLALRDPAAPQRTIGHVRLREGALSGSGVLLHGAHIIDPRTGRPPGGKLGAWAFAPTAALSDALSTSWMVMLEDEIETYCDQHAEVCGMVMLDDRRENRLVAYGGWNERLMWGTV